MELGLGLAWARKATRRPMRSRCMKWVSVSTPAMCRRAKRSRVKVMSGPSGSRSASNQGLGLGLGLGLRVKG